jgi:hypothetical protein
LRPQCRVGRSGTAIHLKLQCEVLKNGVMVTGMYCYIDYVDTQCNNYLEREFIKELGHNTHRPRKSDQGLPVIE